MTLRAGAWLLALCVALGWAGAALSQDIRQNSAGACSPPIVGNQGKISISCPGVAPEALRYLENQLSEQFGKLSEQLRSRDDSDHTIRNLNKSIDDLRQQADEWARRYRELSARLAESPDDSAQAKQARALIQQGEFA